MGILYSDHPDCDVISIGSSNTLGLNPICSWETPSVFKVTFGSDPTMLTTDEIIVSPFVKSVNSTSGFNKNTTFDSINTDYAPAVLLPHTDKIKDTGSCYIGLDLTEASGAAGRPYVPYITVSVDNPDVITDSQEQLITNSLNSQLSNYYGYLTESDNLKIRFNAGYELPTDIAHLDLTFVINLYNWIGQYAVTTVSMTWDPSGLTSTYTPVITLSSASTLEVLRSDAVLITTSVEAPDEVCESESTTTTGSGSVGSESFSYEWSIVQGPGVLCYIIYIIYLFIYLCFIVFLHTLWNLRNICVIHFFR